LNLTTTYHYIYYWSCQLQLYGHILDPID